MDKPEIAPAASKTTVKSSWPRSNSHGITTARYLPRCSSFAGPCFTNLPIRVLVDAQPALNASSVSAVFIVASNFATIEAKSPETIASRTASASRTRDTVCACVAKTLAATSNNARHRPLLRFVVINPAIVVGALKKARRGLVDADLHDRMELKCGRGRDGCDGALYCGRDRARLRVAKRQQHDLARVH